MASGEGEAMDAMVISEASSGAEAAPADALAIVARDLTNPLGILSVVTRLLADARRTDQDRARLVQVLQRATQNVERLVRDLLDDARIDGRRPLAIERRPMDLHALVRDVCESFAVEARDEGKTIDFDVRGELPSVHADGERLSRVLTNLVRNAMDFTPLGGRVRVLAERAGGQVRLSVIDHGRLFEARWDTPRPAPLSTALGLRIARKIVEAHGGALGATSAPDGGNAFFFTLPLAG
jgi:histidine kinase